MTTAQRVQEKWINTSEFLLLEDLVALATAQPFVKITYANHTVYEYQDGSATCISNF